nr:regulatory protein [Kibdelosporangium sp. MJ126-NF4]
MTSSGDLSVSGSVSGQVVQAGAVHGGVHFHGAKGMPAIPRQLTAPPVHFANRHQELAELADAASTVVLLKGQGGVGKTALALRWLSQVRERFPAGELYAELTLPTGEPVAPDEVLGQFLRALGVPPPDVPVSLAERTALFRSLTVDRKLAVLLDNAVSAAQVRVLVPSSPESLVVVTSRRPLIGLLASGATSIQVDPLDDDGAIELLERHVGTERVASERQPAQTLARLCGGLPLALCVAAALTVSRPKRSLAWMARELTNEERRLEVLSPDDELSLRGTFDLSYRDLPPAAAVAYQALGLHHGGVFRAELLAAAVAVPVGDARGLIETLLDASLLEEVGDSYYRLHNLVQAHALALAVSDEERLVVSSVIRRRMIEWYVLAARTAGHALHPARRLMDYQPPSSPVPAELADPQPALHWLTRQRTDLLTAVRVAAALTPPELAYYLVDALVPMFLADKDYRELVDAATVALRVAVSTGDGEAEVQMRKRLAHAYIRLEQFTQAENQIVTLLDGTRARGDRRGEASGLKSLGVLHAQSGRFEQAVDLFTEALEILRSLGRHRAEGLLLIELGTALAELGDLDAAATRLHRAESIMTGLPTPDMLNTARASTALGMVHVHAGEYDAAERELRAALAILDQLAFGPDLARTHQALAELYASTGDAAAAQHHRDAAVSILSGQTVATEDE